ncbi:guanylate kinase [Caenorhabditis elegans]|uniref:guanylate kinase n=1 Tax=Caenorhabditis elegans TaxID=6239 RepID=P91425_CAEEL|nr:guanylate kinase [Caenorhabditis elegans]CCD67793.1 guanylate kinase [Caenorhabditis elegans]|eukprot:NP_491243.1 GUanylate Kinase [Caenorhabditis elegans]
MHATSRVAWFWRPSCQSFIRKMPCRPIVLSGPSGGGKSTILTRAMQEYPNSFAFSVSHTTRQPRAGEEHGKHYYFTEKEKMQEMIKNNEFLEFATFSGNTYGTSKKTVLEIENSGKICVLDIELQGVRNIKNSHLDARYILIRAPSIKLLEERLRARGTETEESLSKRLQHASEDLVEIEKNPTLFDKVIVNDDLERAYKEFVDLLRDDLEKTSKK